MGKTAPIPGWNLAPDLQHDGHVAARQMDAATPSLDETDSADLGQGSPRTKSRLPRATADHWMRQRA
jgi:hypothetical protein